MKSLTPLGFFCLGIAIFSFPTYAQEAAIPEMIQNVQKSIVNIQTDRAYQYRRVRKPSFPELYIKNYFEEVSRQVIHIDYKSEGSGIFIDQHGLILTNAHVVNGAKVIKVVTNEKEMYEAELIGKDTKHDLALIKIKVDVLTQPSHLGDSSQLKVGQDVIAIGSPFGFQKTVTKGIVSAVDRQLKKGDKVILDGLIQTDTSVNPGNSGGPLITSDGKTVGLIVAKFYQGQGLNFAIPIDVIKELIPEMHENQEELKWVHKIRSDYGFSVKEVGADEFDQFLQITEIHPESHLYKAGVRIGDILRVWGSSRVSSLESLMQSNEKIKPGKRIYVGLGRQGRRFFTYVEAL